jgi:hypothetical protein
VEVTVIAKSLAHSHDQHCLGGMQHGEAEVPPAQTGQSLGGDAGGDVHVSTIISTNAGSID